MAPRRRLYKGNFLNINARWKGQHKSEEFTKINPFGKVPAFVGDDGWILTESVAIGRYLCTTQKLDDHWYPADPRARARVDEFLSWHHTGLRSPCLGVFIPVTFGKMESGTVDKAALKPKVDALETSLTQMADFFLKDRDYLAGSKISIADLWGYNEVIQLTAAGYDVSKRHPKVDAWLKRVKTANKSCDDIFKKLTEFAGQHKYDFESIITAKK